MVRHSCCLRTESDWRGWWHNAARLSLRHRHCFYAQGYLGLVRTGSTGENGKKEAGEAAGGETQQQSCAVFFTNGGQCGTGRCGGLGRGEAALVAAL